MLGIESLCYWLVWLRYFTQYIGMFVHENNVDKFHFTFKIIDF